MPGAVASLINEVGELNWPLRPFTGGFLFFGGGGVTEDYGLGGGLQGI